MAAPHPQIPPDTGSLILELPPSKHLPIHLLLPIPMAIQGLMKEAVPRTSHLDPFNLTSTAPPIIPDKVKSTHVFYHYQLFNDFLSLGRKNHFPALGGKI